MINKQGIYNKILGLVAIIHMQTTYICTCTCIIYMYDNNMYIQHVDSLSLERQVLLYTHVQYQGKHEEK